ncbi:Aggrecan core protein [Labeo rohita]|uniref:Aggrecan core protein n=1 Tax=Labeo rohita TaxID=84645 RepID=A0ABQ8MNL1_LABRO|nr:Aggrecan core protein [Labeo rohita]
MSLSRPNKSSQVDPLASRLVHPVTEYSVNTGSSSFHPGHSFDMDTDRTLFRIKQGPRTLEQYIPFKGKAETRGSASIARRIFELCIVVCGFAVHRGVAERERDNAAMATARPARRWTVMPEHDATNTFAAWIAREMAAVQERAQAMAATAVPVYKMAATAVPIHKMAAAPARAHKMAATAEPVHKMAAETELRHVTAAIPELYGVTAAFPESSQVSKSSQVAAVFPESSQVSKSSQVAAVFPGSSQVPKSSQIAAAFPVSSQVRAIAPVSSQVTAIFPEPRQSHCTRWPPSPSHCTRWPPFQNLWSAPGRHLWS